MLLNKKCKVQNTVRRVLALRKKAEPVGLQGFPVRWEACVFFVEIHCFQALYQQPPAFGVHLFRFPTSSSNSGLIFYILSLGRKFHTVE